MAKSSGKRIIHLTAVGSSAQRDVDRLGGFDAMMRLAREGVGEAFEVRANRKFIYAHHDKRTGSRLDDAERAREVQTLLADDRVAAIVTVRGGAWFTRILDRIDFDVLRKRTKPVYLFGFSEMTTLIAITGQYPTAVALYDLGPGYLYGGALRYARKNFETLADALELRRKHRKGFSTGWALARYPDSFRDFFRDVAAIVTGRGSSRVPSGRLLQGTIPAEQEITITGGTLSVMLPLVASKYASAVDTTGKWLAIEDINEAADPIDRMMATLKLSGHIERAAGIILGDFHDNEVELSEVAYGLLKHHLPAGRKMPVIMLDNFGHTYPIAPLPIGRPVILRREPGRASEPRVTIDIPWSRWTEVGS